MRIVIVTEQYLPMVGGVSTVTLNLSQDLAASGHQIWVVAPSEGRYDERREQGKVHVHRFSSFEWPTYDGQRIVFPPVAPLRRLLRTVRPDIVHIHSPLVLGNLAQLLAAASHLAVIGTNHYMPVNVAPTLSNDPLLGKSFRAMTYSYLVSFYNRCDFVTAPTATALDLLKRHGLRAPSRPISNGIDLRRFTPKPRDEALRRALGLPSDRPLIIYVSRLSEEKRVNVLLDAMAQLREPTHLAIGGSGPARRVLEEQAADLGIADRVTFLGHVPDEQLVPLYRLGDIFAMPSIAELQSLATMESMALGLPVVAANEGALPELVHDGVNGFLFAPDDSAALADRLARLAANPVLRRQMSVRSLEIVASHDRRHILDEWQQLYAEVAAGVRETRVARRKRDTTLRPARALQARLLRPSTPRRKPVVMIGTGGSKRRNTARRRSPALPGRR